MKVELIVRIDGQEMAVVKQPVEIAKPLEWEQQIERLKDRVGQVLLEGAIGWPRVSRL